MIDRNFGKCLQCSVSYVILNIGNVHFSQKTTVKNARVCFILRHRQTAWNKTDAKNRSISLSGSFGKLEKKEELEMNISTIAKLANVSTATVSRYLNNGYVSEEKRQKIAEVIARTGYTPSSSAQTLRTGRNNLIGVIVPKISSESIGRMVDGITEIVNHSSYQVLLANTGNDTERELEYLKIFRTNNVDGVIFIGTLMSKKHLAIMHSYKKPIVLLSQQESGVSCVYFDDYGAAEKATDCLIRSGCKRIAHLGVTLRDKAAGRARRGGFMDTLLKNQIPVHEQLIVECEGFSTPDGQAAMQKLLDRGETFDGVFCATDTLAFGAMDCLRQAGISVPDQVCVSAVGNNRMSAIYHPHLTSVNLCHRTGGMEAGAILMEMIQNHVELIQNAQMQCQLFERESTNRTV